MPDLPSEHTDVTPEKAKKILSDGHIRGKPLTSKQRRLFGAIAGKARKSRVESAAYHAEAARHYDRKE